VRLKAICRIFFGKDFNMSKISGWLIAILFLISGCTFNVEVLTPAPVQSTPSVTASIPSPVVTVSPTAEPTFTPVPPATDPVFFRARTASSSQDANQQSAFPAGSKQVYAIWDYQNMREGLIVRREWYWNNQLWLAREEPWDFAKYGANGTIRDISIYDNETGLNSGDYQLRVYINDIPQPIGSEFDSPINPWITFSIGLEEMSAGYGSWDSQWGVEIYGEKRIVLKNVMTGASTEIYTAREVPYVNWFGDSQHFLFVDRDRSGQKPGTSIGIRDDLWMVDVPSGALHLLYKSDTSFAGRAGPMPSPDGKYIASLEGSGYGDACIVDSQLVFLELGAVFDTVKPIKQENFSGLPAFNEGTIYPVEDGYWESGNTYRLTLDGTCNADTNKLGTYLFNIADRTATQASTQSISGDLGLGLVHGKITDVSTGAPISNAAVTCQQHSYTASSLCSGTVLTNAHGEYVFNNVFFHDTDTIEITVQAAGYETLTVGSHSFTINDREANVALHKKP
jgi:hypothetical protein